MQVFDFPSDISGLNSFENIISLKLGIRKAIEKLHDTEIFVSYSFSCFPKNNPRRIIAKCTRCKSSLTYIYNRFTKMFEMSAQRVSHSHKDEFNTVSKKVH